MEAKRIIISPHAQFEMKRRGIKTSEVLAVIRQPGQIVQSRRGRQVRQSLLGRGRWLLRVVVSETPTAYYAVTAYKTSKVAKYWTGS